MSLKDLYSKLYGKRQQRILKFNIKDQAYYLDKKIVRAYCIALFVVAIIAVAKLGLTEYAYASCPDDATGGKCSNDLYGKCDLPACQVEELRAGETVGDPPPPASDLMLFVTVAFGIVAIVFNSTRARQKINKRLYREQYNNKK